MIAVIVVSWIGMQEYWIWRAKGEIGHAMDEVEKALVGEEKQGSDRATALRKTRQELRRRGVREISSETQVRQLNDLWTVTGRALLDRNMVTFQCTFSVARFGSDRFWQHESTMLDGELVYSRAIRKAELEAGKREIEAILDSLE